MITVVSGLPRSGTSLMMQILNASGMELLTDNIREADVNNPKGYFEYEKVKSIMKDNSWLSEADGKAVKVIAQLLPFLPNDFEYRIVFMERDIDEVISSQNKMINKLGGNKTTITNYNLKMTFLAQLKKIKNFLLQKSHKISFINYNRLFENGEHELTKLNAELELNIHLEKALKQIDQTLYRCRN